MSTFKNRINGKRFEEWIFNKLSKEVTPSIILPLKDLTKGEQFTDILTITANKIVGIECKLTVEKSFKATNIRQVVKLKKLIDLNPQGLGYFVIHLSYEGEFDMEKVRVVAIHNNNKIMMWEEAVNEINSK